MLGRFYGSSARSSPQTALGRLHKFTDRKQLTLVSSARRQEAPTPGRGLSLDTMQVADGRPGCLVPLLLSVILSLIIEKVK